MPIHLLDPDALVALYRDVALDTIDHLTATLLANGPQDMTPAELSSSVLLILDLIRRSYVRLYPTLPLWALTDPPTAPQQEPLL